MEALGPVPGTGGRCYAPRSIPTAVSKGFLSSFDESPGQVTLIYRSLCFAILKWVCHLLGCFGWSLSSWTWHREVGFNVSVLPPHPGSAPLPPSGFPTPCTVCLVQVNKPHVCH